jgi:hypothetical protein
MYLIAVSTASAALNKLFMPDYDPKNIPTLDDVIDSTDNDQQDVDLSATPLDDQFDAAENKLDLFVDENIDLLAEGSDFEAPVTDTEAVTITDSIIEYAIGPGANAPAVEPQISTIDNISNEDGGAITLFSPVKAPEDEAEPFESALIDYSGVDETGTSTFDMPATKKQAENQPTEVNQQTVTANLLQSVSDDIVKQLMPELEQQLRLLLKQALKEKLPEDITRSEATPSSKFDS